MNIFIVFQQGVYRHDCIGVFDSFDLAVAAADKTAREDRDDYHDYEVVPWQINPPDDREPSSIYEVNKTRALAKAASKGDVDRG